MKKVYYYAFIVLLIAGTSFYMNSKYSIENINNEILEEIKQESYNGIILKKYTNEKGKYPVKFLQLTKDQKAKPGGKVWEQTAIGDSIVKIKGADYVSIYKKNDSIITFNYTEWIRESMKEE